MDDGLTSETIALRLGVAALCGLLIGLDREIKRKNIGVRTFLLVCLGAAGFTVTVIEMVYFYTISQAGITTDPTRIVQGIITGIGFLGGGAILQAKGHVTGAATGASIWVCGAIGVACGYGFYWVAFLITFYAFVILTIVGYIRTRWHDDLEADNGAITNNNKGKDPFE